MTYDAILYMSANEAFPYLNMHMRVALKSDLKSATPWRKRAINKSLALFLPFISHTDTNFHQ